MMSVEFWIMFLTSLKAQHSLLPKFIGKTTTIADINTTIVDGYIRLLDNLSASNKLDLITKLTASVKTDLSSRKSSLKKAFGALDSKQSAEEIIEEIRNSRVSTRQIESF